MVQESKYSKEESNLKLALAIEARVTMGNASASMI